MSGLTSRSRAEHAEATGFRSSLAHSTSAWGWISHFRPDISRQTRSFCSRFCVSGQFDDLDLSVWTAGFDAMLRFPLLKSSQFPTGQLQPYITVGPAIFV